MRDGRAAGGGAARLAIDLRLRGGGAARLVTCLTSTAPAVTIAAAAMPAAAFARARRSPAETAPPAVAAAARPPARGAGAVAPPGGRRRRRGRGAAGAGAAEAELREPELLAGASAARPGSIAASALLVWRSSLRKTRQRSQVLRWRRTGGVVGAQALGDLAQLEPHLVAGQQARLGGLGERRRGRARAAT